MSGQLNALADLPSLVLPGMKPSHVAHSLVTIVIKLSDVTRFRHRHSNLRYTHKLHDPVRCGTDQLGPTKSPI
jgi:hypothetical protein